MSRVYLLDTDSREYRAVGNIPTGLASGLTFSPDDRFLAMTLNTPSTPSDVFVLDLGSDPSRLRRVDALDDERGRRTGYDAVPYARADLIPDLRRSRRRAHVRSLHGSTSPPGEGPFPVVVSIHGGPEGQSRPRFSSTYQMWMDRLGVAIVIPNVRGSAGTARLTCRSTNGMKREDSVRDIGALLDWIETDPDLDQDRVAVFGGSYGGYMVLASSFHYSERLKAAVDIVGISNFVTFPREHAGLPPRPAPCGVR